MQTLNSYSKLGISFKVILIALTSIINLKILSCIESQNAPIIFPDDSPQPNISTKNAAQTYRECETGSCYSPNVCFIYLDEADVGMCSSADGTKGVCCSPDAKVLEAKNDGILRKFFKKKKLISCFIAVEIRIPIDIEVRRSRPIKFPSISTNEVNNAGKLGIVFVNTMEKLEIELRERKLLARSGTKEFSHQNFFGTNPLSVRLARNGMIALQAAIELARE